jgi:hypothetical protein
MVKPPHKGFTFLDLGEVGAAVRWVLTRDVGVLRRIASAAESME